jgi:hypothetical protein
MAERLSELSAQITNKSKAAVEALLGKPMKTGYWTTTEPSPGATAAQVTAHEKATLDEIWIYTNGRVHFSLSGKALKVDDKTLFDLPPEQTLMA